MPKKIDKKDDFHECDSGYCFDCRRIAHNEAIDAVLKEIDGKETKATFDTPTKINCSKTAQWA